MKTRLEAEKWMNLEGLAEIEMTSEHPASDRVCSFGGKR